MDSDPSTARSGDPARPPVPLAVAAVLVALEGLGIAVFGAVEAFHTTSARAVMGTSTALFFVVFGLALLFCSRGLLRVSAWARGPVLISQLIGLGLAWNFKDADTWGIAVALAVPSVVVLGAMLHPATIAALNENG